VILTFDGEEKRIVYEGEKIGRAVLLIRPGRVLGYHETPEGEKVPIGEWEDLEAAYLGLEDWFEEQVRALGLWEEEEAYWEEEEKEPSPAREVDPADPDELWDEDEPPF